jgi:Glyoxalase-like domain
MARIQDVVFDCAHPASMARFWSAVLDDYEVAPYNKEDLEQLVALGITNLEDDPAVLVQAGPDVTPRLWFQQVPEPKLFKNRVHLDLRADDVDAELNRLIRLGARVLAEYDTQFVLADPEGSEFCLLR